MGKAPAFQFYSADWFIDTAQMGRAAKGLHIDLMAIQWSNGFIAADSDGNPSELSPEDIGLWQKIKHKYEVSEPGKLRNKKLEGTRVAQKNFSETQRDRVKKRYRNATETLPEVYQTSTENLPAREYHLKYEEEDKRKGGTGEKNSGIATEILSGFRKVFPKYPVDQEKDLSAALQLAMKVGEELKLHSWHHVNQKRNEVLKRWGEILEFVGQDKWYSTRSMSDLESEWQRLMQGFHKYKPDKKKAINHAEASTKEFFKTFDAKGKQP